MTRLGFVTGCLEPGRDGVGDYTRDLAAACARAGCPAVAVALRDPHVDRPVEQAQTARGESVAMLRLPPSAAWHERVATTREYLSRHRIDLVSLQFVPYALQPKGIVLGLESPLAALTRGFRVHVMLHETWIGAHDGASLRHRAIGAVQRVGVQRMISRLAPAVVHTSNAAYVALLARAGIPARELPLCGSIPPVVPAAPDWLASELRRAGVPASTFAASSRPFLFGMFGTIPPQWTPEPLFTALADAATRAARPPVVVAIGRLGPGEARWPALTREYAPRLTLCALGPRDARDVSWFLQSVDLGLAGTPWRLIGKSAAAAAMLDHGLPVLVSRDDVRFRFEVPPPADPLLRRLDAGVADWLLDPPRRAPRDGLAVLGDRFLTELDA